MPRKRSLKRNLVPQINLTSFFPSISKWREKNQKWLLGPDLHIKWQDLNGTPVLISGWKWGSPDTVTISISSGYPFNGEVYSRSSGGFNSKQASSKQPSVQLLSYMEIHLGNRQYFLLTVSKWHIRKQRKSIAFSRFKIIWLPMVSFLPPLLVHPNS